jgi:hypothetical protein
MRTLLLAFVALAAATPAALADFTRRVVNVRDGDSLTVLVNKQHVRVISSVGSPWPHPDEFQQSKIAKVLGTGVRHMEDRYGT